MKQKRQPIVVVLGHVDHGKTSLLDALRNTNVTSGEAGGITQSIGASVVTTKDGNKITFIDTPGHAIFSGMRARGSKLADIALLIIDGSDGVKPQTKEAIKYIVDANIPYIVVITKIDLPAASVDVVLTELEKEGIYFEGRGGQTPYIGVSAKKKEKLTELLDLIILLSEVNNVEGENGGELEAFVVETNKDKGGNMVSIIIRNGNLKVGDDIYSEKTTGKVKGLFDFQNRPVKEVSLGEPAKILGFENLPDVGSMVSNKKIDIKESEKKVFSKLDKNKIPLYLKANCAGSLEALAASIPEGFAIIGSSLGDVTESDVLNAKANNSLIFVFESRIPGSVKKLAEMDKVKIERFDIIYELLQRLDEIIKSGLREILGKAEIITSFPFNGKKVAGSKMINGRIEKTSDLRLVRGEIELGKIKAISIKKQKSEINGVAQGEEFGIFFTPQLDFTAGDVIVAVKE
ncbi:MAG TPA: translation initiation factor IF-2 [Patescibacteria group bacterium]|nr:translation initiation factor IF-2 [Patescibacteria group bacterium]